MSKWIAEFELEDGDTMPEHMDLEYKGAKIEFHCRPMWIPCSERLPEEDGECLVTDVSGGAATVTETYFITDCDGEGHWGALDVIAWMPIPKPYDPIEGVG